MKTHREGTPDRSCEVKDLIKADEEKEDGNSINRIRRHRKNRNVLAGVRRESTELMHLFLTYI